MITLRDGSTKLISKSKTKTKQEKKAERAL